MNYILAEFAKELFEINFDNKNSASPTTNTGINSKFHTHKTSNK